MPIASAQATAFQATAAQATPVHPTASDLLHAYTPGASSLFASPRGIVLAEGTYFAVPPSARACGLVDLADRVAAVLRVAEAAGHEVRTVVGAVPFASDAAAHLVVPRRIRRTAALSAPPERPSPKPPPTAPRAGGAIVEADPQPERYAQAVRSAVDQIRAGEYTKVVLARSLRMTVPGGLDLPELVRTLAGREPSGYTFAIDLGGGRTLLGTSPELLVSRIGRRVVANPIAGSIARSPDPIEDSRRAVALLASPKDRHEHAVVVQAVSQTLRRFCGDIHVPAEPSLVRTAAVWHLSTRITGDLTDPGLTALGLATRLHPTPAVCGTPPDRARAAIAELEPFERGFYTGMVGWQDADGDGEWAVTIRCGVAAGDALRLYAGAGIVADSQPAAELAETTAKFGTLLDAVGLSDVA